jgi:hypothetical protein
MEMKAIIIDRIIDRSKANLKLRIKRNIEKEKKEKKMIEMKKLRLTKKEVCYMLSIKQDKLDKIIKNDDKFHAP